MTALDFSDSIPTTTTYAKDFHVEGTGADEAFYDLPSSSWLN